MITRMLAGVGPAGRPVFLKIVYHGPKAMEELVRFDPHLVVGILGGSAGTTRDAFQLLHDAQKYGAKVALFGRKINNAENQLAFVQFLRLIVEGAGRPGRRRQGVSRRARPARDPPESQPRRRPQADRPVDELRRAPRNRPLRSWAIPRRPSLSRPATGSRRPARLKSPRPHRPALCQCASVGQTSDGGNVRLSQRAGRSSRSHTRSRAHQHATAGRQRPAPRQRPSRLRPDEPGRTTGLSSRTSRAGALTSEPRPERLIPSVSRAALSMSDWIGFYPSCRNSPPAPRLPGLTNHPVIPADRPTHSR